MKAAIYYAFHQAIQVQNLPDPILKVHGAVIRVSATGICRSDWHGWQGHDPMISLPHVPGHEFAGVIQAVGSSVTRWKPGDRVTVPFVCACGACHQCISGNQQICDHQTQPGFTHWGSFAELVHVEQAEINLVALPDEIDDVAAASLGCRFITSFRAIVDQARVLPGQWVVVYGCGGVGLSAIMIANALGASVVAIDIDPEKLELAQRIGALHAINAYKVPNIVEVVRDLTSGGAHVSIDALGSQETCINSIICLRKRGKHIQVGLMLANEAAPNIPMDRVIAYELEVLGSHGMQAHRYQEMLNMIQSCHISLNELVGRTVDLNTGAKLLESMGEFPGTGVTVINRF
jgi:alcohol dehydrogenase